LEAVPFEIKKGQVDDHHCLTWHGSPNNHSDRKRRAIAVHYMPGHTYYALTGNHPMEPHIHVKSGEIIPVNKALYEQVACNTNFISYSKTKERRQENYLSSLFCLRGGTNVETARATPFSDGSCTAAHG
jgi:ectoine hydroxylase-related dioxygenase (phytanoyl-CoA dioxygenase family)